MRRVTMLLVAVVLGVLLAGGAAFAAIKIGDNGNNTLRGTNSADSLLGRGGNDKIYGLGSADTLNGGSGADKIYGGAGPDGIIAGPGKDYIVGGGGPDSINGGDGNDLIVGRDSSKDSITCGKGYDRVRTDGKDAVSGDCERVLRVAVQSGKQLRGSFSRKGQARTNFNSRVVDGGATLTGGKPYNKESSLRLKIGGSAMTFTVNPKEKTITRNMSDNILTAQEKRTFGAAGSELTQHLKGDPSRKTNQEAQLLRALAYLSETPVGKKVKSGTVKYSGTTRASTQEAAATGDAEASFASMNSSDNVSDGCETKAAQSSEATFQTASLEPTSSGASLTASAASGVRDNGVYYLPCAYNYNYHHHDAPFAELDPHGYVAYSVRSGPTAFDSYLGYVGRCGPKSYGFGYTRDCLDHDICAGEHGRYEDGYLGSDKACGNEYGDAIDDFWFSVNKCRYRE